MIKPCSLMCDVFFSFPCLLERVVVLSVNSCNEFACLEVLMPNIFVYAKEMKVCLDLAKLHRKVNASRPPVTRITPKVMPINAIYGFYPTVIPSDIDMKKNLKLIRP